MIITNPVHRKGIYERVFKRIFDMVICAFAVLILSPLFLLLTVLGCVFMRGNPFFTQQRPGKDEKIFKLLKFRTMDNRTDTDGNLLPDEVRLNKYGKFLRATSLDELPELFNIIKGDMAIVGPRPLLPEYLPYYTEEERHRHDVRPGLTGLAQINGRNEITWEKKFEFDLNYVCNIKILSDIRIIILTVKKAFLSSEGVSLNYEGNLADIRSEKINA